MARMKTSQDFTNAIVSGVIKERINLTGNVDPHREIHQVMLRHLDICRYYIHVYSRIGGTSKPTRPTPTPSTGHSFICSQGIRSVHL